MSEKIDFLGGLTSTLREEYQERLKYRELVDFDGMIDIWYAQNDYGLLSTKKYPVVLNEDPFIIQSFDGFADGVNCLNFVAESFIDFRRSFLDKVENSTINFPSFLDNLIPVKGYQSFDELYGNWIAYSATKYSSFLQNDKRVYDFSSFLAVLKDVFSYQLKSFPITKSGFCLSKFNDIATTGLVVELASLDYNIDLQKGQILQSIDFKCYLDGANQHGFYVDKNAPWRLMANLDHPRMRLKIRDIETLDADPAHRQFTTKEVFDSIYRTNTHHDDLYYLQDFVVRVYNQLLKNVPNYDTIKYSNVTNKIEKENVFRLEGSTLQATEWIDILVMVRLLELGVYSDDLHHKYLEKVHNVYNSFGVRKAINCIGYEMSRLIQSIYKSTGVIAQSSQPTTQSDIQILEEFRDNRQLTRVQSTTNPGY
tara:strand:- start:93 stop:1364 length:1272 start_codon:yes stop_codon:yes gene_type:complete